jgi:hypothetical protein
MRIRIRLHVKIKAKHKYIHPKDGRSSIGRAAVCGTASSPFEPGCPSVVSVVALALTRISPMCLVPVPVRLVFTDYTRKAARVVQQVRTLTSCVNNENSIFSPGSRVFIYLFTRYFTALRLFGFLALVLLLN